MQLNIGKVMNFAAKAGLPKVEKAYPSMASERRKRRLCRLRPAIRFSPILAIKLRRCRSAA
jgi:hypothetical protein